MSQQRHTDSNDNMATATTPGETRGAAAAAVQRQGAGGAVRATKTKKRMPREAAGRLSPELQPVKAARKTVHHRERSWPSQATLQLRAHGLDSADVAEGLGGVPVGLAVRHVDLHVEPLAPLGVPLQRQQQQGLRSVDSTNEKT